MMIDHTSVPRSVRTIGRLVTLPLLVLAAGLPGCQLVDGHARRGAGPSDVAGTTPGTSADTSADTSAFGRSTLPPGTSAADVMFQSSEPFGEPIGAGVNVFGELDGVGPSAFKIDGKAGFQQHTVLDEGFDADPALSPDGRWILFSSTRHSERSDLYLQRTDGLAVTQLTTDPADDAFPSFSPDGRQVAFASNRSGSWDIYVMDVDGKNVRQLTRSGAQELHPSFSPDGRRVVFCSLGTRSGQWELWTVDVNNLELRMIGYGLFPAWSPRTDRNVIAFQRARQRGTHWFSVWTLELSEGDDARNVTEIAYSPSAAAVAPSWSPDGMRLTFCTIADPQSQASARPLTPRSQDVWTINVDGTDRIRLTDGRGVNASPAWSPDGRIYFVSDRGGAEAVWSVAANKARGDATARKPRLPDGGPGVETASTSAGETH